MENKIKGAFLAIAFVGAVILQPWVLILINDWHLVDALGTPKITWVQAYAIGMIASIYNYQYMLKVDQHPFGKIIFGTYIKCGLAIFIAWILTKF